MDKFRSLLAFTLFRLIAPEELWREMADLLDFKLDAERAKHRALLDYANDIENWR